MNWTLNQLEAVGPGKCNNGVDNHTSSAITVLSVSSDSSVTAVAIEAYMVATLSSGAISQAIYLSFSDIKRI